jgi:hypothetical protein
VGAFHRPPAQVILNSLAIGAKLLLRREPTNAFDVNAIAVWLPNEAFPNRNTDLELAILGCGKEPTEFFSQDELQVGYIPKGIAAVLAVNFPENNVSGSFSVSPTGKPQIRFERID